MAFFCHRGTQVPRFVPVHESGTSSFLAGAEGFEPPSPVLETGSLTVELTPLFSCQLPAISCQPNQLVSRTANIQLEAGGSQLAAYFTSLCDVCLRHARQNLLNSSRPVVVFLFLVVE